MRSADVGQKMVEDVGRAGQPRARLDASSGASIRRIGGAGVFEHRREEDRSGSQLPRSVLTSGAPPPPTSSILSAHLAFSKNDDGPPTKLPDISRGNGLSELKNGHASGIADI